MDNKHCAAPRVKAAGLIVCAIIMALNCLPQVEALRKLPNDVYIDSAYGTDAFDSLSGLFDVVDGDGMPVDGNMSERLGTDVFSTSCKIELFGIPIRSVKLHVRNEVYVMPGGQTVGLSIYCDGVMVAGLGTINTAEGERSPAQEAGIKPGDIIRAVDGARVECIKDLLAYSREEGREHEVKVLRGTEELTLYLIPEKDISGGEASLGMWVRESSIGIGTMSFYVMGSLRCGALGHAVTDPDTGVVVPSRDGKITKAEVIGVTPGKQGAPGELRGTYGALSRRIGRVDENTSYGVYGTLEEALVNPLYEGGIPLAYPEEIKEGPATLLANIDDRGVREYECEIIRVYSQPETESKGIVLKITDEELIMATGGIVQGMSGSPIIQNGKLAGAVTHVFINDPQKGYAIYALWMYEKIIG